MELYQIKIRLNTAIDTLRMNDNYLLINNVNERSITHKLATYMEQTFGKTHDVDFEYNRNVGDLKMIHMLKSRRDNINNHTIPNEESEFSEIFLERTVLPDIIVHKRGNPNKILLVVEVKKSSSAISEDYDIEKLKCYTSPESDLNYQYGAFIKFYTSKKKYQSPEIRYFREGKEIREV